MRLFLAVTDNDWFAFNASKPNVDEVNFWRPSPDATFKVLQPPVQPWARPSAENLEYHASCIFR